MTLLRDPRPQGDEVSSEHDRLAGLALLIIAVIAIAFAGAIVFATMAVHDHLRAKQPVKRIFYETPPEHVRIVMVRR